VNSGFWHSIRGKLDPNGALRAACGRGDTAAVSSLLGGRLDVNSRGASSAGGLTALHEAAKGSHLDIVDLLLANGADLEARGAGGRTTPLALAAWYGHEAMVRHLVAKGARAAGALVCAVHGGNPAVVQLLLESGVDARETGGLEEWSALHQACTGNAKEHDASVNEWLNGRRVAPGARRQDPEYLAIGSLLITHGADVNAREESGKTPLFLACSWGLSQTAALLLEHGADVNAGDDDGASPLHAAALIGDFDLVRLLLAQNADVKATTRSDGSTALHAAASSGSLLAVRVLLSHGANPAARRRGTAPTAIEVAQLAGHRAIVDALTRV
jgi:ankyrin repeat protein